MNSVAVVTGGASGLGLAVVNRFVEEGFAVAIVDISEEKGAVMAKQLSDQGKNVYFFHADVSKQENAKQVANRIKQELGSIDILVNAAGIIHRTKSVDLTEEKLKKLLDINLNGTVFMSQAVQPHMSLSGGGAIVNFGSMLAHYGSKNLLAYAASKGAVIQITKCLAVDWAQFNIRVNAVSPGYIETPLASGATQNPVFRERVLSKTPQNRFGTPDEVAVAIHFLCSKDASFITGVDLPIDGGLLAGDPSLFPPAS
ncbi:SDR family NAD(P)-dependent oxidoreductase [Aneurinibacillus sp. Ricciae_BoGa-3]|uniref:SDR family NAD(P)-dependent oxidoreductase n=1 Tax=Aneurinibacillus sp. Ricciae_BoGa-3 TaxID=3022697 RepID=UPI002340EC58|nr:SDR family oxidoreductase [Aneurinibacillus sp. Ricciae_BoGa-3]WCK55983.1 SDR family NAD(P)-dependent oxidoreductase [Aneurinibacillus sp. Ricciae_BoGa-3]